MIVEKADPFKVGEIYSVENINFFLTMFFTIGDGTFNTLQASTVGVDNNSLLYLGMEDVSSAFEFERNNPWSSNAFKFLSGGQYYYSFRDVWFDSDFKEARVILVEPEDV